MINTAVMKTLLWLEWMKVRKYRAFWAFVLLFLASEAGLNGVVYSAQSHFQPSLKQQMRLDIFSPAQIWSTTAWAGSFGVLLLGLLLIMLVSNEENFRTRRQHVIDGLSRIQVIAAKWWVAVVLLALAWLTFAATTLVLNAMHGNSAAGLDQGVLFALWFLLKAAVTLAVAFMFGLWLKRSGLAIALYLAYVLLLEGIIGHFLNQIVAGAASFLPLQAGASLVSNPLVHVLPGSHPSLAPGLLAAICVGWATLLVVLSLLYIRKADL